MFWVEILSFAKKVGGEVIKLPNKTAEARYRVGDMEVAKVGENVVIVSKSEAGKKKLAEFYDVEAPEGGELVILERRDGEYAFSYDGRRLVELGEEWPECGENEYCVSISGEALHYDPVNAVLKGEEFEARMLGNKCEWEYKGKPPFSTFLGMVALRGLGVDAPVGGIFWEEEFTVADGKMKELIKDCKDLMAIYTGRAREILDSVSYYTRAYPFLVFISGKSVTVKDITYGLADFVFKDGKILGRRIVPIVQKLCDTELTALDLETSEILTLSLTGVIRGKVVEVSRS